MRRIRPIAKDTKEAKGANPFSWILLASLFCSGISGAFTGGILSALQAAALAVPVVFAVIAARDQALRLSTFRKSEGLLLLVIGFVTSTCITVLSSPSNLVALAMIPCIVLLFLVAAGTWDACGGRFDQLLARYAVLSSVMISGVWLMTHVPGERFGGFLHPNYWGLLCFGCVGAALCIRNPLLKLAVITVSLAEISSAEARAALVASVVTLLSWYALQGRRGFRAAMLGFGALIVAAVVSISVLAPDSRIASGLSNTLKLDDPYRGLSTGMSGRSELFRLGIDVFEAHPLFGVGPRMESGYILDSAGIGYAHSGYLMALVEFGAVGFAILIAIMCSRMRLLWLSADGRDRSCQNYLAFALGYASFAIVEPKFFSFGNPVSIIFMTILMKPRSLASRPAARAFLFARRRGAFRRPIAPAVESNRGYGTSAGCGAQ
jgi:O-antigen ligase